MKIENLLISLFIGVIFTFPIYGQEVLLEGYVFESGNRGYLNAVHIKIKEQTSLRLVAELDSDTEGHFSVPLLAGAYLFEAEKDLFHLSETLVSIDNKKQKEFIKIQLHRKPGYVFDATLAEKSDKGKNQTDAITDARIEMYNNTTQKAIIELEHHPFPTFKMTFERGNHYTIMIRKEGYFTKRLEAYVDVKGCILCFDGVGSVEPGVSDVLTEQNQMGTLLANIELQPLVLNEGFELKNIYYDYNSAQLRPEAEEELEALIRVLKDNPGISVSLGSHTDARGRDDYNLQLSQKRAQSVVDYLYHVGKIDKDRLLARGYGETQLINACKNDVECSEEEHQENRRTELIVTGIEQENIYSDLSLAEIIQIENLSDEIVEIGQDGQIVLQSGEAIPDEVLKDIQKAEEREQKQQHTANIDSYKVEAVEEKESIEIATTNSLETKADATATRVREKIIETKVEEQENEPSLNRRASPITAYREKLAAMKGKEEASLDTIMTNYEGNIGETLVKVASRKSNKLIESVTSVKVTSTPAEPENPNSAPSKPEDSRTSKHTIDLKTGESMVKGASELGKTKQIAHNFTGYQIEFLLANEPVTEQHPIFSQHGNIFIDGRPSGEYAYLLGSFREKRAAVTFLKEVMLPRYPTAKLVRYEQGQRVRYETLNE